jgi:phage shock protein C
VRRSGPSPHRRPEEQMNRTLRRSRRHRVVAGVAGGMAEYLGIPVALARLIWVILLLPGGLPGLIPYLVCWVLIPEER